MPRNTKTAVVTGAGLAGIAYSKVLSKFFDKVVLVEKDKLPTTIQSYNSRKGVGQAKMIHMLLPGGYRVLESLLPGYGDRAMKYGAQKAELASATHLFFGPTEKPRMPGDLYTVLGTRAVYEGAAQELLRETTPNLEILEKTEATGLCFSESGSGGHKQVTGVRVRGSGSESESESSRAMEADLVVDCSGSHSKVADWLEEAGLGRVKTLNVKSKFSYGTCLYHPPKSWSPDQWAFLGCLPFAPHYPIGISAQAVENGMLMIAFVSGGTPLPPIETQEDLMAFARSVPSQAMYHALQGGRIAGKMVSYNRTLNCMHMYDQLPAMPDGLLVVGDSACSFNPMYGQGMTVAVQGAVNVLEDLLKQKDVSSPGFSKLFQKKMAKHILDPWRMATGQDLGFPFTESEVKLNWADKLVSGFFNGLVMDPNVDPTVWKGFYEVVSMTKPVTSLFAPSTIMASAAYLIKERLQGNSK